MGGGVLREVRFLEGVGMLAKTTLPYILTSTETRKRCLRERRNSLVP